MDLLPAGRRVLVTGATSGIGAGVSGPFGHALVSGFGHLARSSFPA